PGRVAPQASPARRQAGDRLGPTVPARTAPTARRERSGLKGSKIDSLRASHDPGLAPSGPAVDPSDKTARRLDREIFRRRHSAIEQKLFRLVIRTKAPIGNRQAEESRNPFVAADVGMVHEVKAIKATPEGSEPRILRGVLPPLVRPMIDRVKDLVQSHR